MVKRMWLSLMAACWLSAPFWAHASTAIIYQPQLRDRSVSSAQWRTLFARVHARGFDTLVVQWTKYGDAFGDPVDHAWLSQRIDQAHAAGLRIVLGLDSDPAFFQRQEAATATLDGYFAMLSQRNITLARQWVSELHAGTIAGWYLPMEIDDKRWRDPNARKSLLSYLASERRQLDRIAPLPVYVSSFFAGNMMPSTYAALLQEVQHSGVHAWVQDGAGTGRLEPGERKLYLDAASRCAEASVSGIVYEIFRQTGTDTAFTASPLSSAEVARALAQRAPCGGDSVFFELRYLPEAAAWLPR